MSVIFGLSRNSNTIAHQGLHARTFHQHGIAVMRATQSIANSMKLAAILPLGDRHIVSQLRAASCGLVSAVDTLLAAPPSRSAGGWGVADDRQIIRSHRNTLQCRGKISSRCPQSRRDRARRPGFCKARDAVLRPEPSYEQSAFRQAQDTFS